MSDDQALVVVGLIMVVGILVGIVWVFFDPYVDLGFVLVVAAGALIWWRRRRA